MSASRPPRSSEPARRRRLVREANPPHPAGKLAALLLTASAVAAFSTLLLAVGMALVARGPGGEPARTTIQIGSSDDARPGEQGPKTESGPPPAAELPPGAYASLTTHIGDHTYVVLGDAPESLTAASDFELVGDWEAPEGIVAPLSPGDVPEELRAWKHRGVRAGSCTAMVRGFSLVREISGSIYYAPLDWREDPTDAEVVSALKDSGTPSIAAELGGCQDSIESHHREVLSPSVARDTSLPPASTPERIHDRELANRARDLLVQSDESANVQSHAQSHHLPGREDATPWWDVPSAEIETEVLRDPETGAEIVSVFARADEGCGNTAAFLWGLYDVGDEGELAERAVHVLDHGARIHPASHLSREGEIQWLKTGPFGSQAIVGADAEPITKTEVSFFGCAC